MQFENRNLRPLQFRLKQVNEQSQVCDVMVKVGHWEKKYHKCVLQFCPFFECLFANDFLERHTGTINIKRGTPSSVDTALMYLYGKKPKLGVDNIADLIDLAEFFMMPNLKSDCVKRLESITISEENCMHILEFSSLYDFDLPNCTNYFVGHLVEMLSHETALHLTCDSVNYILTEKTFSYLGMEDRLRFLARWYKTQPKHRFSWVKKFLKMLTFEEIPSTIVDELKTDLEFGKLLSGISTGTFNPEEIIPVHMFIEWQKALCFDIEHKKWFRINLSAIEHDVFFNRNIITDPNSPVVYVEYNQTDECKVIAFNLATGVNKDYKVDYKAETEFNDDATRLGKFQFCKNLGAGFDTKLVKPNKSVANACNEGTMNLVGEDIDRDGFDLLYNAMSPCEKDSFIIHTVYIRYDEKDNDIIKMMPKFSLKGTLRLLLAMNPLSEVAIVPNSDSILIYDNNSCSMTKLEVKTHKMDKIFSTERGFVIRDDTRCICITRLSVAELSQQYKIKTISLDSIHRKEIKYFFCSHIWFRLMNLMHAFRTQYQCVNHDTLLAATKADYIKWNDLPLPTDSIQYCKSFFDNKMYLVGLPRRMLRCHPKCPHCDVKHWERSIYTLTSDSD